MGGFFGVTSRRDCIHDVFFGVDYHSHLGTRRGGMAAWSGELGFQRSIHNIETTPFRTKFAGDIEEMSGCACIGCISDSDPQPMLIRSRLGTYAICTTGLIRNGAELSEKLVLEGGRHFEAMSGGKINSTELVAALINCKKSFVEGIRYANDMIEGTVSILILSEEEGMIAARDKLGRLPILIGRDSDGYAISFEPFAYNKLGYEDVRDLGPGEIVHITPEGVETLDPPHQDMKICAFLWTYYGYPNSSYEGKNVEVMRNRCGELLAKSDGGESLEVDAVCGVPDSGIPYAIGYSNASHKPFTRPFIKYTPTWPRSFMPDKQSVRNQIAHMKMIPVSELIRGKKLLFVDDSIVRGTQLRETVEFLYENGADEVHMRSACPPVMYGCKYLNFTRSNSDMELIARRTIRELEGEAGDQHIDEYADGKTGRGRKMRECICKKFGFTSLEFQTLEGLVESIGLPECKVCTYCWNGRE